MRTGSADRPLLVGCGILRREVRCLIEKNGWPLDSVFLGSALHIELGKLAHSLKATLAASRDRKVLVFYGCCHPLMDQMLAEARTLRTCGQNCIDMLLGSEVFQAELANGAFFLLEEWARSWERILKKSFGTENLGLVREIFRSDRSHLIGIRTPCSGDFTAAAEEAGRVVDVPVRWMDVSLDHLESVMQAALTKRLQETS